MLEQIQMYKFESVIEYTCLCACKHTCTSVSVHAASQSVISLNMRMFVYLCVHTGLVEKNRLFLYHLWNRTALFYPQIMTKPRKKKIWDAIFLFRTITPLNTTFEKESLSAMVKGGVVRKRKIKSQIFFLLGLVMICGQKSAVRFQR